MRIPSPSPQRRRNQRTSATTLIELLVSSSVAVLVVGTLMMLVLEVAKEQRRGLVDATLQIQANLVEDKVTRLLRFMSAQEGVQTNNLVSAGSPFARTIVVAGGPSGSGYKRQQISYDPAAMILTHWPDRTATGNQVQIFKATNAAVLRNFYFFLSSKLDGSLDSATINVFMQMDDNYAAGRRNRDGTRRLTQVTRAFAVRIRNN